MARRFTLEFLKTETAAGALLGVAALLGLLAANSPWREAYAAMLHSTIPVQVGGWRESLATVEWINEGLMAVFFYVVGLEIRHEVTRGELSSPRRLALPVLAAAGGMVAPALVYLVVNAGPGGTTKGWPVPVATDIAFTLAALALVGRRASPALRSFLLALAVADDLGAVVLIAVLYSQSLDLRALAGAGLGLAALFLLSRWRRAPTVLYLVGAVVVWGFTLKSGVNTSVAAVAAALFVPVEPRAPGDRSMLQRLTDALHPYVAYGVLPLFAFAAAGFSLSSVSLGGRLLPVTLGIALALIVGKPLGVFGAAATAVRLKLAHRPAGVGWDEFLGAACLCGVGFTMSLFLGALAFPSNDLAEQGAVRLGIILGSLGAVALGAVLLRRAERKRPPD